MPCSLTTCSLARPVRFTPLSAHNFQGAGSQLGCLHACPGYLVGCSPVSRLLSCTADSNSKKCTSRCASRLIQTVVHACGRTLPQVEGSGARQKAAVESTISLTAAGEDLACAMLLAAPWKSVRPSMVMTPLLHLLEPCLKEYIHPNAHAGGGLKERQAIYEQRRKQLGISAKRPRSTPAVEAQVKEESQNRASPEAPAVNPAVAAMMAKMGHKEGESSVRVCDIVHTCSIDSAGPLHVSGSARHQSRALRHRALCTIHMRGSLRPVVTPARMSLLSGAHPGSRYSCLSWAQSGTSCIALLAGDVQEGAGRPAYGCCTEHQSMAPPPLYVSSGPAGQRKVQALCVLCKTAAPAACMSFSWQ